MVCENNQNISVSILFSYFFVCLSLISYILMVFNNILKNVSKIKVIKYHDDSTVDDSIIEDEQQEEQQEKRQEQMDKQENIKEDIKNEEENTNTNTIKDVLNTNLQTLRKENEFFNQHFKFPVISQNEMVEIEKLFNSIDDSTEDKSKYPTNKKNKTDRII